MSTIDILAQHIDNPTGVRHRCVLLDALRLKCCDCVRTIDLRGLAAVSAQSTSTSSQPLPLRAPDACERHVGQRAGTCGPCRAEQLETDRPTRPARPTADVAAGIAACHAALRRQEQEAC